MAGLLFLFAAAVVESASSLVSRGRALGPCRDDRPDALGLAPTQDVLELIDAACCN